MEKPFYIPLIIALGLVVVSCHPSAPPETAGVPDLVISDVYKVKTPQGSVIGYTIENQGGADAGASTSVLYAGGEAKATDAVPPLARGGRLDRKFADWIFDPVTPLVTVSADTDGDVAESDEANNQHQASIGVEVVFDFIDEAQDAAWQSGPPPTNIGFGADNPAGSAKYVTGQQLEDGSVPARALINNPDPVDNGWIAGTYTQFYSEDYTLQPGEHFFARVGFLAGSQTTSARFSVMLRPEGGPNTWMATVTKPYGTPLQTIDVPLDGFAGKQADFVLRVEADGPASQDATWAEARIIR